MTTASISGTVGATGCVGTTAAGAAVEAGNCVTTVCVAVVSCCRNCQSQRVES